MKYADIRDTIKSGDLLAWTHKKWNSWYDIKIQLVRMFTRSEYSHVGIAWVVAGRVFVVESVTPYIRIVPLSNLLPCYLVHMDCDWKNETEEFALSLVGKGKYSQLEAIMAALDLPTPYENGEWECAKFCLAIYDMEGQKLGVNATPSSVVEAAQRAGKIVKYINP